MNAEKTPEKKEKVAVHSLAKQQNSRKSIAAFANQNAVAQRKLQKKADDSPLVQQLKSYQEIADHSARVKQIKDFQSLADKGQKTKKETGYQNFSGLPVQRVVVAGEDQDNLTIASALPAAIAQAGGPVQDWNAADLAGANTIAIVAHGSTGSISLANRDYNGTQLAEQLIVKNIQRDTNLLLWACQAGVQEVDNNIPRAGSSLVETTANALTAGNVANVTVNGFRGVHMFLAGDNNASRIVNPGLTGEDSDIEESWLMALSAINMHYVYLSGYFSTRYLDMYMTGWRLENVELPSGENRILWKIDNRIFEEHASSQTRVEFREKEILAYHPPLVIPEWLDDQNVFNTYKTNLWLLAGVSLLADDDFKNATLKESPVTHAAMTRTAIS